MLGASATNYFNKCGISQTDNLTDFQSLSVPDLPFTSIQCAAIHNNLVVMSTQSGSMITTSNFQDYDTYDFNQKQNQVQKMVWNQEFVAAGFTRNVQMQEQACVWLSTNGADEYSWRAAYLVQDDYSAFTNMITTLGTQIMAVGHAQNLTQSLMLLGSVNGTWQLIPLPAQVQGGLWSVASDGLRIWVGGRGWIAQSSLANLASWIRTDLPTKKTIQHIQFVNNQVIALVGDQVYTSSNGVDYTSTHIMGRNLTVSHVHDGEIILGSHSLLTQSDLFVWNSSDQSWQPRKSQVHAQAFLSI